MADLALLLEAERRGLLPPDKVELLEELRRRGSLSPEGLYRPGAMGSMAPTTAPAETERQRSESERARKGLKAAGVAGLAGVATGLGGPALGARFALGPGATAALGAGLDVAGQLAAEAINQGVGYTEPGATDYLAAGAAPLVGRALGTGGRELLKRGPWATPGRQQMASDILRAASKKVLRPQSPEAVDELYAAARRGVGEAEGVPFMAAERPQVEAFRPRTKAREIPRVQEVGPGPRSSMDPYLGTATPEEFASTPQITPLGTTPKPAAPRLRERTPYGFTEAAEPVRPPSAPYGEMAAELQPLPPKQIPPASAPLGEFLPEGELTFPGPLPGFGKRLYRLTNVEEGGESALPQAFKLLQDAGLVSRTGKTPDVRNAASRTYSAVAQELEDHITNQKPGWQSAWDFLNAQSEYKRMKTAQELDAFMQKKGIMPLRLAETGQETIDRPNIARLMTAWKSPSGKLARTQEFGEQLDPAIWDALMDEVRAAQAMAPAQTPHLLRSLMGSRGIAAGLGEAGGQALGLPSGLGAAGGLAGEIGLERLGTTAPVMQGIQNLWAGRSPYRLLPTAASSARAYLGAPERAFHPPDSEAVGGKRPSPPVTLDLTAPLGID